MSLLSKANTITTPTAYSNGFLHSVKPEVVENLLLQSNQFDTTWFLNTTSVTSGQSGYDGTNDAWLLNSTGTGFPRIEQTISASGVLTLSVYAKPATDGFILIRTFGADAQVWFNLNNGNIVNSSGAQYVSSKTENVGNGWYRCSVVFNGSLTSLRFYPASAYGVYSTSGNGIYIQDAQLNKGYSAYPYLETTTEAKPSADFSFTRNSSATRVNELGYIEDVQIIGGELVSNGDFEEIGSELIVNGDFSNGLTNWNAQEGWYADNGVATFDYTTIITTSNRNLWQTPLVVGKAYKLTFDIVSHTSGSIRNVNSAITDDTEFNSVGTFTQYFIAASPNTYLKCSTDAILSIDNVSVKEVGQDWTFNTSGNNQWSIAEGQKASYAGTATDFIITSNILTIGRKYRVSFDILDTGGSTIRLSVNSMAGGSFQDYTLGDGRYTEDLIAGTNYIRIGGASSGATFSIDNISVKEVTDDTDLPRINYEGFTYAESLGDNLVVNGTFDTDSNWIKGTGWTISGGQANADTIGNYVNFYQNNVFTLGKRYYYSFEVTSYTQGDVRFTQSGIDISGLKNAVGTYTGYFVATQANLYIQGVNSFIGSIDNVSVQEVIGDLPVPYSGKGHLLLEPQRSNSLRYSEGFSANWTKYLSTLATDNSAISPDGESNATLVEKNGQSYARVDKPGLGLSSNNYCYSVFAKKGITDWVLLRCDGSTGGFFQTYFDLENGVVGNTLSTTNNTIEDYGNGWYRCSVFGTTDVNTARIYPSDSDGGVSNTNDASVYLWGAMLEVGDYVSSYIPALYGTAVTRLGETCNNATQSYPTEGVLYAEIAALADDGLNRSISISDGSTSNRINILFATADNNIRTIVLIGGVTSSDHTEVVSDFKEFNKIALRYKQDEFTTFINGVQVDIDLSGNTFSAGTMTQLSFNVGNGSLPFYGKTKMIATFPYLSNDEMECLTGEGYGTFEALAAAYSYTIK